MKFLFGCLVGLVLLAVFWPLVLVAFILLSIVILVAMPLLVLALLVAAVV